MEPFDLRLWKNFCAAGPSSPAVIDHIAIDSRRIYSSHTLFVALPGSRTDGHHFIAHAAEAGARYALVKKTWKSPVLPEGIHLLRVENPLHAFQEISSQYRRLFPCKVLGIIGSYGKTMVKDLLLSMVSPSRAVVASPESFNSQIGVPLSLLQIRKHHAIALIEIAFSKRNEIERLADIASPDYSLLTHIGRKHLATLGSLEQTGQEMETFLQKIPSTGWVLLPRNPLINASTVKGKTFFWNQENPALPHAHLCDTKHGMVCSIRFPDGYVKKVVARYDYIPDLLNLAIKSAWLLGASTEAISNALNQGLPEPMRTEMWHSPTGALVINDTYCSDPQSVDVALRHFEQCRKTIIFGGLRGTSPHRDKEYRRIANAFHQADPHRLILVGRHPFTPLIDEVKTLCPQRTINHFPTYKEAFHSLKNQVTSMDTILIKGETKPSLESVFEAFHGSICTNQCTINLTAIAANLTAIRKKIGQKTRIMAVVKASAYGTHDVRIAAFLQSQGVDIIGVSYVDEGIGLRRAGAKQNIFVLNATPYETAKIAEWNFEVGVSDKKMVTALAEKATRHPIKVHLHIDTGMRRFGCRPEEAVALARLIKRLPSLQLEGILTHFACADSSDSFTLSQVQRFDAVIDKLAASGIAIPWKHAANSGALMRFHLPQFNMVRIGLALYGLHSSPPAKKLIELQPAISLYSRIVGVNVCKKGETISYGGKYTVEKDNQRIAVVPFGYFDGLHRHYSGKGCVMIHGQYAPMVGAICMDYLMVDITHIPKASIGDPVLIFGSDECGNYLAPEKLAEDGQSIVHELVSCLGPRIQRIFVYDENPKSC